MQDDTMQDGNMNAAPELGRGEDANRFECPKARLSIDLLDFYDLWGFDYGFLNTLCAV